MVFFVCNHCGETMKKQVVDKHVWKCKRDIDVSCMDCLKDFKGEEYCAHTSCISETQKYSSKDYVPKANANKGAKKQENWVSTLRSINETKRNLPKGIMAVFDVIQLNDNVPRKMKGFMNFFQNSAKHIRKPDVEAAWFLIEEQVKRINKQQQGEQQDIASSQPDETGSQNGTNVKRKHDGEEQEQELSKKKERKMKESSTNERCDKGSKVLLGDETTETNETHQEDQEDKIQTNGKDYVPKTNDSKAAKKQKKWISALRTITETKRNLPKGIMAVFDVIQPNDNIPSKMNDFMNFFQNSGNNIHKPDVEAAWSLIEEQVKRINKQQQGEQQDTASSQSDETGSQKGTTIKQKLDEEEQEQELPKKKERKMKESSTNERCGKGSKVLLGDETTETNETHQEDQEDKIQTNGKDYVPKANDSKAAKKQKKWISALRTITETKRNLPKGIMAVFDVIQLNDNIPRKINDFMKFFQNSGNNIRKPDVEAAWSLIDEEVTQFYEKQRREQQDTASSQPDETGSQNGTTIKRKHDGEEQEQELSKKKKKSKKIVQERMLQCGK